MCVVCRWKCTQETHGQRRVCELWFFHGKNAPNVTKKNIPFCSRPFVHPQKTQAADLTRVSGQTVVTDNKIWNSEYYKYLWGGNYAWLPYARIIAQAWISNAMAMDGRRYGWCGKERERDRRDILCFVLTIKIVNRRAGEKFRFSFRVPLALGDIFIFYINVCVFLPPCIFYVPRTA